MVQAHQIKNLLPLHPRQTHTSKTVPQKREDKGKMQNSTPRNIFSMRVLH